MRTSTFLWRDGSEGGGWRSSNRSGGWRELMSTLLFCTTWCVSGTVPRNLTTPCSLCLGEFRCALSTSSCSWRGKLLRELTTNYCSTTVSGNNFFFFLLLLLEIQ